MRTPQDSCHFVNQKDGDGEPQRAQLAEQAVKEDPNTSLEAEMEAEFQKYLEDGNPHSEVPLPGSVEGGNQSAEAVPVKVYDDDAFDGLIFPPDLEGAPAPPTEPIAAVSSVATFATAETPKDIEAPKRVIESVEQVVISVYTQLVTANEVAADYILACSAWKAQKEGEKIQNEVALIIQGRRHCEDSGLPFWQASRTKTIKLSSWWRNLWSGTAESEVRSVEDSIDSQL